MDEPHVVHALETFTNLVRKVNALGAVPAQIECFGPATIITIPSCCIRRVRFFAATLVRRADLFIPATVRHCLLICAKLLCTLFHETRIAKK